MTWLRGPTEETKWLHDFVSYASFFVDRYSHMLLMVFGIQYALFFEWNTVVMMFAVLVYTAGAVFRLTISFPGRGRVPNPIHGLWASNLATAALLMFAVWFPSRPLWIVTGFFLGVAKPEAIATCVIFFSPSAQDDGAAVVEAKMRLLQYEFVVADMGTALSVTFIFYYPVLLRPCVGIVIATYALLGVGFLVAQYFVSKRSVKHKDFQRAREMVRMTIGPDQTPLASKPNEDEESQSQAVQEFNRAYTRSAREIAYFGFICEASSYAVSSYMYSVVLTLANFNPIALIFSVFIGTSVRVVITHKYHRVLTHQNVLRATNAVIVTSLLSAVLTPFFLTAFRDMSTLHLSVHTVVMAAVGLLQQAPVFIATNMNRVAGCSVHQHLIQLIRYQLLGRGIGVAAAYCLYVYGHSAPYVLIGIAFAIVRFRYKKSKNVLRSRMIDMLIGQTSALSLAPEHETYVFGQS